jgi:uncharacterized membrane protein YsdA (DUF1294 family)
LIQVEGKDIKIPEIELFTFDMIWGPIGPIIIAMIFTLAVSGVILLTLRKMNDGILKELFRILSLIVIVGTLFISIYVAAITH